MPRAEGGDIGGEENQFAGGEPLGGNILALLVGDPVAARNFPIGQASRGRRAARSAC